MTDQATQDIQPNRIILRHRSGSKANRTEEFPLAQYKTVSIGRAAASAVKYDPDRDDLVSREHAKIEQDQNNPARFTIEDLNSSNGTFVNKRRILGVVMIKPGDVVQLGPGGPEFEFDLAMHPDTLIHTTRIAESSAPTKSSTAAMESNPPTEAPSETTTADGRGSVGKEMVERMIPQAKGESKRVMVPGEKHSSNQAPSRSNSNQFTSYRMYVREAKKTAAEACNVSSALEAMQDTLPKWWRVSELTRRDIDYEPFRAWQEVGKTCVTQAESNFITGEPISIVRATQEVETTLKGFDNYRSELKQRIENEKQHLRQTEHKLTQASNNIVSCQKSLSQAKSHNRGETFPIAGSIGLLGFLGGCMVSCSNLSDFGEALGSGFTTAIFISIIAFAVIYYMYDNSSSMSEKRSKLNSATSEKASIQRQVTKIKHQISLLEKYEKSTR